MHTEHRFAAVRSVLQAPGRFRRDEEGGMVFFALVILLLMLFVGGMAVDLMRYESERTRIQATADASVLAAASMRQTKPPRDVVEDWFAKAQLTHALVHVDVDIDSLNYRRVRADTRTVTRPYFMHMLGVDELRSVAFGQAEERRANIEISMVLDISGSMAGTRMTRLVTAANEFVTNIIEDDTENRVSISLVPYNGQVNIGADLMAKYNITNQHTQSYCVDLPQSAYSAVSLSRTTPMPQNAFADTYNSSASSGSYTTSNMAPDSANRWCLNNSANQVRVMNNNRTTLTNQISNLTAVGATSIDAGLRWGAALLDPGSREMVSELVDQGRVPSYFRGRPFEYDDREALKVIVLMTDGEHWPNEFVADGYRSGASTIYKHTDGNYSIYHASRTGTDKFWIPHKGAWRSHRWAGETCTTSRGTTTCTYTVPSGSGTPLDWQTVWRELRVHWVAYQLYARAVGGTQASWLNVLRVREGTVLNPAPHEVSQMDNRMNGLCTLLKGQNVTIFGIAFEAPSNGITLIRNCSSAGRFYDVSGANLTTAFRDIRAQISALRLTQ